MYGGGKEGGRGGRKKKITMNLGGNCEGNIEEYLCLYSLTGNVSICSHVALTIKERQFQEVWAKLLICILRVSNNQMWVMEKAKLSF